MPDESKAPGGMSGVREPFDKGSSETMTLESWQDLLQQLDLDWPATRWRDVGVIVGCSGGADSVCMLRALAELRSHGSSPPRGFIVAAHFNHRLRGSDSDQDQQFVEQLADQLGVSFVSDCGSGRETDEASLRSQRVDFLSNVACRLGARYVALAHLADDNVETVLHHLLRGTGPSGLAGIRPYRSLGSDLVLIRPVLRLRRDQIRDALRSLAQPWREDASNQNSDYRRNWIRNQVLPMLREQFPHASDAVLRAIDGQREWLDLMESQARDWIDQHQLGSNPLRLRCDMNVSAAVVVLALQRIWDDLGWPRQPMGQVHWQQLAAAIASNQSRRFSLPGGIDVSAGDGIVQIVGPRTV